MLFDNPAFVIRERVAVVKLTDTYDILHPNGGPLGIAKEEPHPAVKWLRLIVQKNLMPTTVNVYESETSPPVLSIRRGVAIFRPKVEVTAGGRSLGHFQAKAFTIGGAFRVFDAQGAEVGLVKGNWKGREYQMTGMAGEELGRVTKQWGGVAKELFTNADTYVIAINEFARGKADLAPLLLAAGLAIDTVFKEQQG